MARKHANTDANPDFDLDKLFTDVEGRARKLIENINKWVTQSEELIERSRGWIDEHPVASGVATKYGRRLNVVPKDMDEARETAKHASHRVRQSFTGGVATARSRPLETALLAAAAGLAGYAIMRVSR